MAFRTDPADDLYARNVAWKLPVPEAAYQMELDLSSLATMITLATNTAPMRPHREGIGLSVFAISVAPLGEAFCEACLDLLSKPFPNVL